MEVTSVCEEGLKDSGNWKTSTMVFDQKYWRKKAKENNSTVTINTEGITLSKFLRDTLYKKKIGTKILYLEYC